MTRTKRAIWAVVLALLLVMFAPVVRGAPPEGYDPSLAEWYRSLERPDVGGSCCDRSDCREVTSRIGPRGYQVLLEPGVFPVSEQQWIDVPDQKIIQGKVNPTGRAVLCYLPNMGVICFVRGTET